MSKSNKKAFYGKHKPFILKNEGNILPIDEQQIKQIAVIGKLARQDVHQRAPDCLTEDYAPESIFQKLEKIWAEKINLTYTDGYLDSLQINETIMNEAQRAAYQAELVLVFVGFSPDSTEQTAPSQPNRLPAAHAVLIDVVAQVNKNVVVIVRTTADLEMPWKNNVKAILRWEENIEEILPFLTKDEY